MPMGILFWILMILWFIFGIGVLNVAWAPIGGTIILFILLGLLGWKVFGPVLRQ